MDGKRSKKKPPAQIFATGYRVLRRPNGQPRTKPQGILLRRGSDYSARRNCMAVTLTLEVAEHLLGLYMTWCGLVKTTPREYVGIRAAALLKKRLPIIAVVLEPEQVTEANELCAQYEDDKGGFLSFNYVISWCVATGSKQLLDAQQLMSRWPNIRPTLSSVACHAFEFGIKHFKKYHNPRGTCI